MHVWLFAVSLLQAPVGPTLEQRKDAIGLALAERRLHDAAEGAEAILALGVADPEVVGIAGNLRAETGHHAHAYRHYAAFLEQAGTPMEARKQAAELLARLTARTRVATVRVTPAVSGKLVAHRVDGRPPPDFTVPIVDGEAVVRVDFGEWEFTVTAPGHAPLSHTVARDVVQDQSPFDVRIALVPVTPVAVPPPVVTPPPRPAAPVQPRVPGTLVAGAVALPLGVVGLGGLFVVLPAYLRTAAARDRGADELAAHPCGPERDSLAALLPAARRQEAAMLGLGVTGAVLVTVGAVLLARGARTHRRNRLRIDAGPGAVLLGLTGRF